MKKLIKWIKRISAQKHTFDFLAAVLSIPVLVSVIALNLNNLAHNSKSNEIPTSIPKTTNSSPTIIFIKPSPSPSTLPSPVNCDKGIGNIDISYPKEGETVTDNPVCVDINYDSKNYCPVVWAYSINNGPLSSYSNNSACLYDLPTGENIFQLKIKSLVSPSTQTLIRKFMYKGPIPTPSPTATPTPIQSITPSPTDKLTPTPTP